MYKVFICGITGRMGTLIAQMVRDSPSCILVGGMGRNPDAGLDVPVCTLEDLSSVLSSVHPDVIIDFTEASVSLKIAEIDAVYRIPLVIGSTGFSANQESDLFRILSGIPVVKTTNFSMGVNIFWELVREAAKRLKDYDIEVVEAHHRNKKDAPSGTAKTILRILEDETGKTEEQYGRCGVTERKDEIGVHVIRGGNIVGDHTVEFHQNFETISLTHRAYDRSVFASGAVKAAEWVVSAKPGMYTMKEVLGLDL